MADLGGVAWHSTVSLRILRFFLGEGASGSHELDSALRQHKTSVRPGEFIFGKSGDDGDRYPIGAPTGNPKCV